MTWSSLRMSCSPLSPSYLSKLRSRSHSSRIRLIAFSWIKATRSLFRTASSSPFSSPDMLLPLLSLSSELSGNPAAAPPRSLKKYYLGGQFSVSELRLSEALEVVMDFVSIELCHAASRAATSELFSMRSCLSETSNLKFSISLFLCFISSVFFISAARN